MGDGNNGPDLFSVFELSPPLMLSSFDAAFVLSLLLVLSSPLVLSTLRLRLFYGDFSRTGAPALDNHVL